MFAKDTIEDRIYQRLDDKLYEITQTIGSDDEREAYRENILGIIAEELNFDELYKEVCMTALRSLVTAQAQENIVDGEATLCKSCLSFVAKILTSPQDKKRDIIIYHKLFAI